MTSNYEQFKYLLKSLSSEDIGALMLVVPFALALLALVVVLATIAPAVTFIIVVIVLWFGTAVHLMTKN